MILRILLAAGLAVLTGCATAPPPVQTASAEDCAVLMLAAGFIAEHQPPLRLRPVTADLSPDLTEPERYSPDADPVTVAAISFARLARRTPPQGAACPLAGLSPFVQRGRAELVLANPAFSPAGDFAVVDAQVRLPRRTDHYRLMFSGPPKTGWDIHRIEFEARRQAPP